MVKILRTIPIPKSWLAAYAPDIPKAYEVFRVFLASLSLSLTDLAKDIGVDQSTVSRWAVGRSRPTPEQMKALLAALQSRIEGIAAAAERATQATEALHRVVQAFEASLEPKTPGRGSAQAIRRAAQKLHEVVKEPNVQRPPSRARRKAASGQGAG